MTAFVTRKSMRLATLVIHEFLDKKDRKKKNTKRLRRVGKNFKFWKQENTSKRKIDEIFIKLQILISIFFIHFIIEKNNYYFPFLLQGFGYKHIKEKNICIYKLHVNLISYTSYNRSFFLKICYLMKD